MANEISREHKIGAGAKMISCSFLPMVQITILNKTSFLLLAYVGPFEVFVWGSRQ